MPCVSKVFSPCGRKHKLFPALCACQGLVPPAPFWSFFPRPSADSSHACVNLYQLKTPSADLWSCLLSSTLLCELRLPWGWPPTLSPPLLGVTRGLETLQVANWGKGSSLLLPTPTPPPPSQVHCPMLLIAQCLKTVVSCILSGCLRWEDKFKYFYSILAGRRNLLLYTFEG